MGGEGNETASLASEEKVNAVAQRFFVCNPTRRLPPRRKALACFCVGFKAAFSVYKTNFISNVLNSLTWYT
jgi:hypothetical protein